MCHYIKCVVFPLSRVNTEILRKMAKFKILFLKEVKDLKGWGESI